MPDANFNELTARVSAVDAEEILGDDGHGSIVKMMGPNIKLQKRCSASTDVDFVVVDCCAIHVLRNQGNLEISSADGKAARPRGHVDVSEEDSRGHCRELREVLQMQGSSVIEKQRAGRLHARQPSRLLNPSGSHAPEASSVEFRQVTTQVPAMLRVLQSAGTRAAVRSLFGKLGRLSLGLDLPSPRQAVVS